MGTPSTTSTVGGDAWYYIGQKLSRELAFMPAKMTDQNVLAIYFDKGGKVARIANYGMKDGKVFDFVSRTTPTGGPGARLSAQHPDGPVPLHLTQRRRTITRRASPRVSMFRAGAAPAPQAACSCGVPVSSSATAVDWTIAA